MDFRSQSWTMIPLDGLFNSFLFILDSFTGFCFAADRNTCPLLALFLLSSSLLSLDQALCSALCTSLLDIMDVDTT